MAGNRVARLNADRYRLSYNPHQVLVPPTRRDREFVEQAVSLFTRKNPFTRLEIVFFEPEVRPDPDRLLDFVKLDRPHYLDMDLRFLYAVPGNRAVIFTLVTEHSRSLWHGGMQRSIYWWRHCAMPATGEIHKLEAMGFDSLLIDVPLDPALQVEWQDRMAAQADDLLLISFGIYGLQHRWMAKTSAEDYYLDILPRD